MKLIKTDNIKTPMSLVWKKQEYKEQWENVINDLSAKIHDLELIAVAKDQRKAAWQTIKETEISTYSEKCRKMGLSIYPLQRVGNFEGFIHYTPQPKKGEICNVYTVITKSIKIAEEFIESFRQGDHVKQGALLGFPRCCTDGFTINWKKGYFDPVYQAYLATKRAKAEHEFLVNPLLRYIGIRGSFHIPCSLHCEATKKTSQQRLNLLDIEDYKLIVSLLNMEVKWSCLNGIAIIDTTFFKIITGTVITEKEYKFIFKGKLFRGC